MVNQMRDFIATGAASRAKQEVRKMGISGFLEVRCKECKCRFGWHISDSWPFVDSEIVGTCSHCLYRESHDCVDELQDENGVFAVVGRKEFSPSEPGQGVRGHSADARVASVKELDLPPESSGRGRTPTLAERMNDLIQKIRECVVNSMHTDDGGYDRTAEDIRKMMIAFDRGE